MIRRLLHDSMVPSSGIRSMMLPIRILETVTPMII